MSESLFSDVARFVRAPRLSGLSAAPKGPVVATRTTIGEDESEFVSQLFSVGPGDARQLTFGPKSASLLAVGKRGEIYFRRSDPSSDEKGDAIWMLPPAGEAREVFRYKAGIKSLHATETSLFVVLSVMPESTLEQSHRQAAERKKTKVTAVLHERFPTRYWDTDLGPGHFRLFVSPLPPLHPSVDRPQASPSREEADKEKGASLPPHELDLRELALPSAPSDVHQWDLDSVLPTPDGRHALVSMRLRENVTSRSQVWLLDAMGENEDEDEPRLLAGDTEASFATMSVSPSGTWALLARFTPPLAGQPPRSTLERVDLPSGERRTLTDHEFNGAVIGHDDQVYFTADRKGRGGIFHLSADGSATLLTEDDEMTYGSLTWANDHLVALRSSIAEPARVIFLDPKTHDVTEDEALTIALDLPGTLTEVRASALDGTPLRAWLVLPDGEGPHPLVVFAHGGPWGSWNDWTWRWNPWVFAARGYAVLLPDPGISTGYGPEIGDRGHDAIGDEPFTDIMALTDAAVARHDIDGDCQLFAGGSYGGYMANWVAGHTGRRFRRIVTHASLWNIESMGRTTDNGGWYEWMMAPVPSGSKQGPPQAALWSPHRFVDEVEVPMLVIHGANDHRVPISQGLELWMDLQRTSPELGHKYLYYPDEGHWILKPGNAEVWYETFLGFLDEGAGRKQAKSTE